MAIPLGPFRLFTSIARGGMGEVWRGVHEAQQLPVAVKVVTAKRARDAEYRRAFRNEVRAMARLDHPGVVTVLDFGEIGADVQSSAPSLIPGSPYLVMEWVGEGSLANVSVLPRFGALKYALLRLLDALAHAHARGVIHRDIKPSNVLLSRGADDGLIVKLTDFGIAGALEGPGVTSTSVEKTTSGTPKYMAPEQIRGEWRDQGPWTDLYAVGCLTYRLATGYPPFWRGEVDELLRSHIVADVPRLKTKFDVPDGFQAWVDRMLEKDSTQRYARAADAAYDLRSIGDEDVPPISRVDLEEQANEDGVSSLFNLDTIAAHEPSVTLPYDSWSIDDPADVTAETRFLRPGGPPVPTTWRRPEEGQKPMDLIGAGLALYGLRPIPLIDRDTERDRIWDALRRARDRERAQVVVLHGEAGNGKSRLAEWAAERAHEVGAATVMKASFSPMATSLDGFGRMLAQLLRCTGLTRREMSERITMHLQQFGGVQDEEYETLALASLMQPYDAPAVPFRFNHPRERHAVLCRMIRRFAQDRCVLVWLDDVQYERDALAFTEYVLAEQEKHPTSTLILLTARDALTELPGDGIQVERLDDSDHAQLIHRLLRLEGELADQVQARTGGNPLFAVQLVGDWVQRGVLVVGGDGFKLREGETAPLPNDIHGLWTAHVDRIVTRFGERTREALEVAACLGEVEVREWRRVCEKLGVEIPAGLIDALVSSRLAATTPQGWSFAHGMLRESLQRSCRDAKRWEKQHAACAGMLRERYPDSPAVAERVAMHLLSANRLEDALDPLLIAAAHRTTTSDFPSAHAIYARREEAMVTLDIPENDSRWARGWGRQARTYAQQGKLALCAEYIARAENAALKYNWEDRLAEVYWLHGHLNNKRGEVAEGIKHFRQGLRLYERVQDRAGVASCLYGLGELLKMRGDHERAVTAYEKAIRLFEEEQDLDGQGIALAGLSDTHRRTGDAVKALELSSRALECLRRIGNTNNVAVSLNDRGDICRYIGSLEEAEALYREAVRLLAAHASTDIAIPRMNLASVLITRGQYDEAEDILVVAREELEEQERRGYLAFIYALFLPCASAHGEWDAWESHHDRLVDHLAKAPVVDEDLARPIQLAGDLCLKAGESNRARALYEVALEQWRGLAKDADATLVEKLLAKL